MPTRAMEIVSVLDQVEVRVQELATAVTAINNHLKTNAASVPEHGSIGLPSNPLPLPNPLPKLSGGKCMMMAPWDLDPPVDLQAAADILAQAFNDCGSTLTSVGGWGNRAPFSDADGA